MNNSFFSEINENIWQVWVDTGGTFTDCIAIDPSGKIYRAKVLSNSALRGTVVETISKQNFQVKFALDLPDNFINGFRFHILNKAHSEVHVSQFNAAESILKTNHPVSIQVNSGDAFEVVSSEEAPTLVSRLITKTSPPNILPTMNLRLATTKGTNALLERKGAATALFITKGFGDLLKIGTQQRPDLFAMNIVKSDPLYDAVVEVPQRIDAQGNILKHLDVSLLENQISYLIDKGIRNAAVAFMHSYCYPDHEKQCAEFLLKKGFDHVSCSSDLAPFIKILQRTETAIVDAYLASIIGLYLDKVQSNFSKGRLHTMTSAGGLVNFNSYCAKDSLLSGPAGGVVGAARAGKRSGYYKVIAFDMGGTSTDVARFDKDYDYVFEHQVGDAHLVAPALAIESVASGGGSICSFDGHDIHVGPHSAGANPGPACYGVGGPFTITDVNLLLGRLDPMRFEIPINKKPAKKELERIVEDITQKKMKKPNQEKLLEGFIHIACERMADAIRRISIRKGYDPQNYALLAFGGAGGQHACSVAERLGIKTVLIPQDAGILSALGLGSAVIERFAEEQVLKKLEDISAQIKDKLDSLIHEAKSLLSKEGISEKNMTIRRIIINMRFAGQDSTLPVEWKKDWDIEGLFKKKYLYIFGHWPHKRSIEVESIRVVASSQAITQDATSNITQSYYPQTSLFQKVYFKGNWRDVPKYERKNLSPGAVIKGPVLIFDKHSTTVVEPDWKVIVDQSGSLILKKAQKISFYNNLSQPEVIQIELFTHRFESIAREMGEMLRRTAMSTNAKERLDLSCAILDNQGELVVNAPHIPVHLGSLGLCVRALNKKIAMKPGDVIITNHPEFGGSHLPDITVVTPIFLSSGLLLGYAANRAHHAELGGISPGSMPPTATKLAEEGVVIPPTYILRQDKSYWNNIKKLLSIGEYPSRAVEENIADIQAAVAANRNGANALIKLTEQYSAEIIFHYMNALKEKAEDKIKTALKSIPDGQYKAEEILDDGSILRVAISIKNDQAYIDFNGSSRIHPGNLNATPAIVRSAVIYVLRLLVNEPLPLNEGLMRAVIIHLPSGMLNPCFPEDPEKAPAVVGGNVETSQRLVDTLLKALKLIACSQGTMNNVLFGNDRFSYYETVCGGCGAGKNFQGASAVHSHMTNTRITDPEIIEHRYPVLLEQFAIRKNSGGKGRYKGGDGAVREIVFLENMSLSVLGQHRIDGPYGLEGGESGKPACQKIIRLSGKEVVLQSIDGIQVNSGDRLILETPGGGGYGRVREK